MRQLFCAVVLLLLGNVLTSCNAGETPVEEALVDKEDSANFHEIDVCGKLLAENNDTLLYIDGNLYFNTDNNELTPSTICFANGGKYEGQLRNFTMHGTGKLRHPNGNVYIGEFRDGLQNGNGSFTFVNGDHYEGEWRDGRMCGHGSLWLKEVDNKYVGEFDAMSRITGQGAIYFQRTGERYEGSFLNGMRHGNGTHFTST